MDPNIVLKHLGLPSQSALARKLGLPVSTVAEWFQNGRIPRLAQFDIETLTRGKIRAERRRPTSSPQ